MNELINSRKKAPEIINRSKFFRAPTSCQLQPYVEPAVNRQPGFRQELVEQTTYLIAYLDVSLLGTLFKFRNPEEAQFPENFLEILKIFIKISTFSEREARVQNLSLVEHES